MDIRNWIILVVIAGFVAAASSLALTGFGNSLIGTISPSTVTNESRTLTNATAASLSNPYVTGVTQVLVNYAGTFITLNTNEYVVANLNQPTAATITLTNNSKSGNTTRTTYTWLNVSNNAGAVIVNNGNDGLSNVSTYFGVTGTIVGVLLLLTAVGGIIMAFSFRRE